MANSSGAIAYACALAAHLRQPELAVPSAAAFNVPPELAGAIERAVRRDYDIEVIARAQAAAAQQHRLSE